MGNSEVGHMNIGSGRVVYQDYTRIENAIESGEFFTNPVLAKAVATGARHRAARCISSGLLSPGGVHSHESQIHAMLEMAARAGVKDMRVHAFLDGRDTPPKSAEASLAALQEKCAATEGRAHRLDLRPLLRHGPRPALGTRASRPTVAHAGRGRIPRRRPRLRRLQSRLRARRDRRIREADRDRPPGAHRRA